ncbi:hypothetical protein Tel_13025 [Candidatus Tenderia electrophaga]|jgi:ParB-like chromosome segregation protein Spo0J|uniref:Uncharacterized protein n=1 Tax=Candidatus Tenderia electrophaga TaxID=1748243 RepID=A0A0S2TFQ5_9GAMM|nr:hypothetical protein Tel_13025 [Candidatus Tenderia electrophaga]
MTNAQARKIEHKPVADLAPYASNGRSYSNVQVAHLDRSIQEFGFTDPVLTDADSTSITDHGCVMAAQWLGSNG